MEHELNPYQRPDSPIDSDKEAGVTNSISRLRAIAFVLILTPITATIPIFCWTYFVANDWIIAPTVDENLRQRVLFLAFSIQIATITPLFWFPGFLLLWHDGYRPVFCAVAAIVCGLLLAPTAFVIFMLLLLSVRYGY